MILSDKERKILVVLATGDTYKGAGFKLYISEHTVRAHMQNIMRKLRVGNTTAAVVMALRQKELFLSDIDTIKVRRY